MSESLKPASTRSETTISEANGSETNGSETNGSASSGPAANGMTGFSRAASLAELEQKGCLTVQVNGHTVALFRHEGQVYAVDNRCPHMGFPLDRGTVKDGILTCHWHHARFDLASGGTFDQWADDVRAFPAHVREGEIWIDTETGPDPVQRQKDRLKVGLERDISLVIAKAVLTLMDEPHAEDAQGGLEKAQWPFRTGLAFGAAYRMAGWGQGLTMHVCFRNLLPYLEPIERPRAMTHGLAAVARDSAGEPPRFPVRPLPDTAPDLSTLKRWFRRFVEVRDAEGAERCVVSALRMAAEPAQIADMLFAAVTDRRYIDVGHPADFTNKALEALDIAGWDLAEPVLTSLVRGYAGAARMEESNAWRNPIDLIEILHGAFEQLPDVWAGHASGAKPEFHALAQVVLEDDPQATVDALLDALRRGYDGEELAAVVCYAAARRIAQFHTSNEFGDWDTALHTFTFANAMHQGLRRAPSPELLRGVFDAAMSVYLDRFLNMPAARLPTPHTGQRANGVESNGSESDDRLHELATLLDRQQQVNPAAATVARYLHEAGTPEKLMAQIGKLLLREDRDFHTIQCVEAAIRQATLTDDATRQSHFLIAAIRYLAAHSPTVRAQGQTYRIASRLHRGEEVFAEEETGEEVPQG